MCCYTLLFCCTKSTIVLHKMHCDTLLFCCIKYTANLHKIRCYMLLFNLFCCGKSDWIRGCDILHMLWLCWIFSLIYWRHWIVLTIQFVVYKNLMLAACDVSSLLHVVRLNFLTVLLLSFSSRFCRDITMTFILLASRWRGRHYTLFMIVWYNFSMLNMHLNEIRLQCCVHEERSAIDFVLLFLFYHLLWWLNVIYFWVH